MQAVIKAMLALALTAASARVDVALGIDAPAVVLFWAPWCAPCRSELAAYRRFVAAAAPLPVYLVALDTAVERRGLLATVPPQRLRFPAEPSFDLLPKTVPRATGLPLAIVLAPGGRICARSDGVLTEARLATMLAACGR